MPTPIPNIWQLQLKGDIDGLINSLRHPESSVRRGAVAALRTLGAWQAVPAIEAALAVETDWQVHAVMMTALQYLDRDIHIETMVKNRDIKGLSKMLNSPKVEDLLTACKALGSMGDRQAVEPLIMVFRNPMMPNKVKLAAAEALLELESAPAVVTLLGALRRDNWQVRRNAAAVLGQLQAVWATEPLIRALEDENQAVQKTATAALQRMGTPEAIQAVKAYEEAQRRAAAQQSAQSVPKALSGTGQLRPPVPAKSGTGILSPLPTRPVTGPLSKPGTGMLPTPPTSPATETLPHRPAVPPAPIPPGGTPPTVSTATEPPAAKTTALEPQAMPIPAIPLIPADAPPALTSELTSPPPTTSDVTVPVVDSGTSSVAAAVDATTTPPVVPVIPPEPELKVESTSSSTDIEPASTEPAPDFIIGPDSESKAEGTPAPETTTPDPAPVVEQPPNDQQKPDQGSEGGSNPS